jgi:diacylglycerol kinase
VPEEARPSPPHEAAQPERGGAQGRGVEGRGFERHSLAQSFGWAWAGLAGAAVRERNMRIHLALGVLAGGASSLLPVTGGERALLLLAVALVVAGEAANSALEAVVDLVSPAWNARARVAKDAAAGAVLALAGGSLVVLLAVALPAVPLLRARWASVAPGALGGLAASVATLLLPAPGRRPAAVDVALGLAGACGLALVAWFAEAAAGIAAAALLLAVAAGGAVRRRRDLERGT